jgi:hypothetical protein
MQPIPLFEDESEAPELKPTADLLTAMNIVKKTLCIWGKKGIKSNYSDLVAYIGDSIKMSKQIITSD